MFCDICGEPTVACKIYETLVGYEKLPGGHNHDDNCRTRGYRCKNGHTFIVSRRNRCPVPGCDWRGKETCFCHPGQKVDEWPE